jgi:hypothetical protein
VLVGHKAGKWWLTTIGAGGVLPPIRHIAPAAPPPSDLGTVTFTDGVRSAGDWEGVVADAIARIGAGAVEKVVLARDLQARSSTPIDPRRLLTRLAERYPGCWTFNVDGLLGATPEMLVKLERGLVTSRVLAGTIRRSQDDAHDLALAASLARSSKDLEEHEYAVRSVAEALAPYCATTNVPESPFVLHLANVMHLATDVTGVLAGRERRRRVGHRPALRPGRPGRHALAAAVRRLRHRRRFRPGRRTRRVQRQVTSDPRGPRRLERRRAAVTVGLGSGPGSGQVLLAGAEFRRSLLFVSFRLLLRNSWFRRWRSPGRFGVDVPVAQVDVSGGAGDDDRAGWVLGVGGDLMPPPAFVLQPVIVIALGLQVLLTGRPGGPGNDMVQVAGGGGAGAGGGAAGQVPGFDELRESDRWPVGRTPVVQELPAEGVGDQSPPGAPGFEGEVTRHRGRDRAVSGEFGGFLV